MALFRRTFQPIYMMNRLIVLFSISGLAISMVFYVISFGLPVVGFGWQPTDQVGESLRVLFILAPGLLVFLPLFLPAMQKFARESQVAREHCGWVAFALAVGWGLPVLIWEFISMGQLEGFEEIPGRTLASAVLPIASGLVGLITVLAMRWEPPDLVGRLKRLWSYAVWPAYVLLALLALLALRSPSGWPP
jgi:hypothetical protein